MAEAATRSRKLDMNHGFLKSIARIQVCCQQCRFSILLDSHRNFMFTHPPLQTTHRDTIEKSEAEQRVRNAEHERFKSERAAAASIASSAPVPTADSAMSALESGIARVSLADSKQAARKPQQSHRHQSVPAATSSYPVEDADDQHCSATLALSSGSEPGEPSSLSSSAALPHVATAAAATAPFRAPLSLAFSFLLNVGGVRLALYSEDQPHAVAAAYCRKHSIADTAFEQQLAALIRDRMAQL